jgi:hypothetical protein
VPAIVHVTDGLVALEVAGLPLAMVQLWLPAVVFGIKVAALLVERVVGEVVKPASGVCTERATEYAAAFPQAFPEVTVMFPDTAPVMETVILAVPCPLVMVMPAGTVQV